MDFLQDTSDAYVLHEYEMNTNEHVADIQTIHKYYSQSHKNVFWYHIRPC